MRRFNFMLLAAMIFGLGWAATPSVQAEGFAEKVPAVGTSVTYDYKASRMSEDADEPRVTTGELVISVVGKEDTDDGEAFWIEIKRPGGRRGGGGISITKVLILGKEFGEGKNPFANFIRGLSKRGDGELREFEAGGQFRRFRSLSPIPHFEELAGDKTETVEIEGIEGPIECKVRTGESDWESEDGERTRMTDATLWLNSDVPFGLIKADISSDVSFGERAFTTDTEIVLKKIEHEGAKSELPDAV